MCHENVSFFELEENLVDINSPDLIPKDVLDYFWKWKEEQGSLAAGISHIKGKGWYIVSPAFMDNEIIKFFPDNSI